MDYYPADLRSYNLRLIPGPETSSQDLNYREIYGRAPGATEKATIPEGGLPSVNDLLYRLCDAVEEVAVRLSDKHDRVVHSDGERAARLRAEENQLHQYVSILERRVDANPECDEIEGSVAGVELEDDISDDCSVSDEWDSSEAVMKERTYFTLNGERVKGAWVGKWLDGTVDLAEPEQPVRSLADV